jgi:hypothetical protein
MSTPVSFNPDDQLPDELLIALGFEKIVKHGVQGWKHCASNRTAWHILTPHQTQLFLRIVGRDEFKLRVTEKVAEIDTEDLEEDD